MTADGGGYEVRPAELRAAARRLTADAADLVAHGRAGADAAGSASAACGGGPLEAALTRFEVQLGAGSAGIGREITQSASALEASASTYVTTDQDAAGRLSPLFPGSLPGGPGS